LSADSSLRLLNQNENVSKSSTTFDVY
jgi:hypothetical protein